MRKYDYFRELKKVYKKNTNISMKQNIFHLKYMHPPSIELAFFHYFHVLSGDLELLKGHELEEDVNTLFMYKFVEKWQAKIVKDAQLAMAEMCDSGVLRRPDRLRPDEERKGIEEKRGLEPARKARVLTKTTIETHSYERKTKQ